MRRRRTARAGGAMLLALALAAPIGHPAVPTIAQDASACTPESEPNDQLTDALPSLTGDLCRTGTLPFDREQDLVFWEVLPEDALTRWTFTVRGVPTTVTSVRVFPILSSAGPTPTREGIASSIHRVDSDAHPDTPPGVASLQLPPGRYLLGISRGWPSFGQTITDDVSYEVSVVADRVLPQSGDDEPNDDQTTAAPVRGAFELAGDLAGSEDHYRWTVSADDAATPWRLEARSALDVPISIDLLTADGTPVAYAAAPAAPEIEAPAPGDGIATLHDLGLAPGEYRIRLRPWSDVALPYVLAATPVTEPDVDAEPNDVPEQAIAIDPATGVARGRLTSALDVDQFVLDVGDAFDGRLVDIDLSSTDAALRRLCISTEEQTQVGCFDGEGRIALPGMLLAQDRYLLTISGAGDLEDRYELRVGPGEALPPAASAVPGPDAATASPVSGAFAVSGDLTGSASGTGHVYAWTLSEADGRTHLAARPVGHDGDRRQARPVRRIRCDVPRHRPDRPAGDGLALGPAPARRHLHGLGDPGWQRFASLRAAEQRGDRR